VVSGNRFDHVMVAGIWLTGAGVQRQSSIVGNHFVVAGGAPGAAIRVEPTGSGVVQTLLVSANLLLGGGGATTAVGMDFVPAGAAVVTDLSVLGNHFFGFATGVNVTPQVTFSRASGNTFADTPVPYSAHLANTSVFPAQADPARGYLTVVGNRAAAGGQPGSFGVLELGTFENDGDGVVLGLVQFTDRNNTTDPAGNKVAAAMLAKLRGLTAGRRGGQLEFYTKPDGGSLSAALILDALGNSIHKSNAYVELGEVAPDPDAPPADRARLYLRDNGAGKTELVVKFATGAVQVLARQP
jgi:hypothetical protein